MLDLYILIMHSTCCYDDTYIPYLSNPWNCSVCFGFGHAVCATCSRCLPTTEQNHVICPQQSRLPSPPWIGIATPKCVCIYVYVWDDRAVNHPMIARNSTCDLSVLRLNYANSDVAVWCYQLVMKCRNCQLVKYTCICMWWILISLHKMARKTY